jgi:hypothetical protein
MFDSLQNNKPRRQNGRNKNNLRPLVLILGFFAIASLGIVTFALLQKWNYTASAAPGIYKVLNYQGKLEDSGGVTVADGAYNIKFTIYDAAAAGTALWSARESDACGAPFNASAKSVTTSLGVFSTQLGESGDCPLNLDFNTDSYYLGITIGADSEMTPRKRIGATGYAFNSDLLDGLNTSLVGGASSFVPATDASGNLVLTANVTFDTPTFFLDSTNDNIGIGTAAPDIARTLDLTTAKKYGVYSVSSFGTNDATGVYGETTSTANIRQYGVYGTAAGPTGHGVHGAATATGGPAFVNYGGYFTSTGDAGYGVYGEASASGAVTNIGGYFLSAGDTGYGVYSLASGTAGVNYGGYFRANGAGGYGVYGYAADTTAVVNYGGYFRATGSGIGTAGVYSEATGATLVYGVYGTAPATGAIGNYGVYGTAAGDSGTGVYGGATATTGATNVGVTGASAGDSGYGVYGMGTSIGAVTNYGGYFTAGGTTGIAVYGAANNAAAAVNYGGQFYAYGQNGRGVYGQAAATGAFINYGGVFDALGNSGIGVYGTGSATGAVANYGGYFTAAGDSGIAVYGEATSVAGTASNIGGSFRATGGGNDVYGVMAVAFGAGNNFGIYASTTSATGWAGYFNGGKGIYADRLAINDAVSVVTYNTIGTAAASHTAAGEIGDASDLFIADDLEIDGWAWLDGGFTDLAEMVAYTGEGEAGDVIVIDKNYDNTAKIATEPYDQTVLGVISEKPSLIITGGIKEGKLLAVAGRIPTKVTNINGAIHRGDPLTTSSMPGYAMKATEAGPIVGKALGECDERECNIWVFLNISWFGGI